MPLLELIAITYALTLKSIPFSSYIKAQPGHFRPGDIYDNSD